MLKNSKIISNVISGRVIGILNDLNLIYGHDWAVIKKDRNDLVLVEINLGAGLYKTTSTAVN